MITVTKKTVGRENLDFVVLAVAGKKDPRLALRHIRIKDNIAAGCDGYRLHIAPFEAPNGVYSLLKSASNLILIPTDIPVEDYPDIEKVTPDKEDADHVVDFYPHGKDLGENTSLLAVSIYEKNKSIFNSDYLRDLAQYDGKVYLKNKPNSPLLFVNCEKTAVVMPVVIKQ